MTTEPQTSAAVVAGPAGGSELLRKLEHEADQAVAECLENARGRAAAILASAQGDVSDRCARERTARVAEYARQFEEGKERRQLQFRAELLETRANVIDRIFLSAGRETGTLAHHASLGEYLRRDIDNALRYFPDEPAVVCCRPELAEACRSAIATFGLPQLSLEVSPDVGFGIVVRSADGRVVVNVTLERRIKAERSRLAIHAQQLLQEMVA